MTNSTHSPTSLSFETERLRLELGELNRLGSSFGSTMSRAFASAILDGRKFSDVLRGLAAVAVAPGAERGAEAARQSVRRPVRECAGQCAVRRPHHAVRAGRHRQRAGPVPLAQWRGTDGRGGPRSDHAAGARERRQARCPQRSRGGRHREHPCRRRAMSRASARSQSQIAASMLRAIERGRRNL